VYFVWQLGELESNSKKYGYEKSKQITSTLRNLTRKMDWFTQTEHLSNEDTLRNQSILE